ncbi:hypothetical protein PQR34_48735 [Paraburkholderia sediminicola]|uniref:hypothetical protein n=1 Tax=Paraburkholderia sediminicola TaxID=458836 RepID=UPI0038B7FDD2
MSQATDSLAAQVRMVLLHDWDSIGIQDIPKAQDEYDMYVPAICRMIRAGQAIDEIYGHLRWIERDRMGLDGNELHTNRIAIKLLSLPS